MWIPPRRQRRLRELRIDFLWGAQRITPADGGIALQSLVEAYQRAAIRHDDSGTTPPAGADVILRSGEIMRFWGGSEGIQGVCYRGRDVDLRGQELGDLLERIARMAEQGGPSNASQPIRSESNGTSGAAGSRR